MAFTSGLALAAALASALALNAARAETIISFDPGKGENTQVKMIGLSEASGTWVENDFRVGWYYDNINDIFDGNLPDIPFRTLSAGPYGYAGTSIWMDVTQRKGKPFSLLSVAIDHTLAMYVGYASLTPYDANGNLDYNSTRYEQYAIKFDDLLLTGVKRTGEVVTMLASSFGAASLWETYWYGDYYGVAPILGDGLLQLDEAARALFSDLVSLRVTSNWPRVFDYRSSVLADAALDPIFKRAAEVCTDRICDMPGVGHFEFLEEYLGDVPAYTTIGGFVVQEVDVAPVPLERSAAYLLVALTGLALAARRAPTRSSRQHVAGVDRRHVQTDRRRLR